MKLKRSSALDSSSRKRNKLVLATIVVVKKSLVFIPADRPNVLSASSTFRKHCRL